MQTQGYVHGWLVLSCSLHSPFVSGRTAILGDFYSRALVLSAEREKNVNGFDNCRDILLPRQPFSGYHGNGINCIYCTTHALSGGYVVVVYPLSTLYLWYSIWNLYAMILWKCELQVTLLQLGSSWSAFWQRLFQVPSNAASFGPVPCTVPTAPWSRCLLNSGHHGYHKGQYKKYSCTQGHTQS